MREAAQDPALVATEVADYLVAAGVPFRQAHEIVGKVLRAAEQEGKSIREMPMEKLEGIFARFRTRSFDGAHGRSRAGTARRRRRHGARRGPRGARGFQRRVEALKNPMESAV